MDLQLWQWLTTKSIYVWNFSLNDSDRIIHFILVKTLTTIDGKHRYDITLSRTCTKTSLIQRKSRIFPANTSLPISPCFGIYLEYL